MKLKIKVKRINKNLPLPEIIDKGDWIDLRSSEEVTLKAPQAGRLNNTKNGDALRDVVFDTKLIRLGVAMELPAGCEAHVVSRSSTYGDFTMILANAKGVIDQPYKGDKDEWRYKAIAFGHTTIHEGDRICQFRIVPSQKATLWQKLRYLLSSGVKIVEVDRLGNPDRGGIGTTGIQ